MPCPLPKRQFLCGPLIVKSTAFDIVKTLLCAALVLSTPCLDEPFKLEVDASLVVASAVSLQWRDGVDRTFCYFSKKFNSYQLDHSTIEKEALALIWAFQHYEVYVGSGNGSVVGYTDHNPISTFQYFQIIS